MSGGTADGGRPSTRARSRRALVAGKRHGHVKLWSQTDVKRMSAAMDHWATWYRPLDAQPIEAVHAWQDWMESVLADPIKRAGIITGWERGLAHAARDRMVSCARTSLHYSKMGPVWGQDTSETVDRFARFGKRIQPRGERARGVLQASRERRAAGRNPELRPGRRSAPMTRAMTRDELRAVKQRDPENYVTHVEIVADAMTRLEAAIEMLQPAAMRLERYGVAHAETKCALEYAKRALSEAREIRGLLR